MTKEMVRGLVGALIKKGRKSSTILSYMASLKKAHEVERVKSAALEDWVVKAAKKTQERRVFEASGMAGDDAGTNVKFMRFFQLQPGASIARPGGLSVVNLKWLPIIIS